MGTLKFTNLTGAVEIGANCYLIEGDEQRILLDSGMHPKKEGSEALPRLNLLPDDSVDAIVLTHAHQDHIGSLPVTMRRHPHAPVFMTEATRQIGDVMLHNSANVMLKEQEATGNPPHFAHREVDIGKKRWMARPLHQQFDFTGERVNENEISSASFEFFDAGHILGSAGALLRLEGKTIFYAGDVNFQDQTIMRAARFPEFEGGRPDVMIMESTRGDRAADPAWSRTGEADRLAKAIQDAFARGGCALIPLFALGKTQELLAMFYDFKRRGLLRKDTPIYIGGLGAKLTELYDKLAKTTPRLIPELDLMDAVSPFVLSGPNVDLRVKPGRIYAISSGMMTEKTLSNRFARSILEHPEHSILFVGYADPASPAGLLRAAKPGDFIALDAVNAPQPLRCHVEAFNFSAHASRESICDYVRRVQPKKLVLVHGDTAAIGWLTETLRKDLPQTEVVIPEPGVALEL